MQKGVALLTHHEVMLCKPKSVIEDAQTLEGAHCAYGSLCNTSSTLRCTVPEPSGPLGRMRAQDAS